jgi:hypothetical protein
VLVLVVARMWLRVWLWGIARVRELRVLCVIVGHVLLHVICSWVLFVV